MAITTTTRKVTFVGNDTATVFPFAFKVFKADDLYILTVDASGNLTLLALGTDYSAVLNLNQDTDPGGAVTLTAGPLATGISMTITSDVAELQQVILTNLGGFFPDVLNGVFDRLTILIQQLQQGVDQSIKLELTDPLASAQLPPATQRLGKFLYFSSVDGSVSLVSQAPDQALQFNFAGALTGTKDGVNKIFTITNGGSPIGVAPVQAIVWQNYVKIPGIGYTLGPSPGQVQFTDAPDPQDDLYAEGIFVP